MPTERTVRRPRTEDRRRQLTTAAAALFFERGYPHVSVADIARRAGVSTPTLYRHFDDKQALLFAATQGCVAAFERSTDEALDGAEDQAAALIDAAAALSAAQPQVTSLWRWSGQHLTAEQNREVVARTREVLRRWAGAIAQRRPDLTRRESTYLAGAILSVTGSISGRSLRVDRETAESTLRQLIRRLMSLTPSAAPPIPEPPTDLFATPGRRDEILDAAAGLFAEQGFAGTGMDEIGAAVGITGPSVYKHFPSKESILLAIGQRSALRLEAGALAAAATSTDPRVQLDLLVDSYVQSLSGAPDLRVSFESGYVLAGNPQAAELIASQRRYVARWIELTRRLDDGLGESAASLTVHAALAIVNDAVRMPRSTPRPEFAARMAYLMKGLLHA